MPTGTATEKYRNVSGDATSRSIGYVVTGATGDEDAFDAVVLAAPGTHEGLKLVNVQIEEEHWPDRWIGTAQYSVTSLSGIDAKQVPDTSDIEYSFNTSLGSQHIFSSKSTVERYYFNGTDTDKESDAPGTGLTVDYKKAINVDEEQNALGADILVPESEFTFSWYPPNATVTDAYKRDVNALVGKVNSIAWRSYPAGTLLFAGVSGQARTSADWELLFNFRYRANQTGLTLGDITGVDVEGWDYLWVKYEKAKDANKNVFVAKPIQANIERVYDRDNFLTVLGF